MSEDTTPEKYRQECARIRIKHKTVSNLWIRISWRIMDEDRKRTTLYSVAAALSKVGSRPEILKNKETSVLDIR